MRAIRVLVLRHHEEDSPGFVADAFSARGAAVDTYLYTPRGRLPDLGGYTHLVILGSSASLCEAADWVAAEVDWLRGVPIPVMGICFGAQLLSTAFGGNVERSPAYEIGWVTVDVVAAHRGDSESSAAAPGPVISAAPGPVIGTAPGPVIGTAPGPVIVTAPGPVIVPGPWFQFHGDRCVLPEGARLLARNEIGVQAFTIGQHLGVQFHPEVDAAQLERWMANGGRKAVIRAGMDPDSLLEETELEEPKARVRAYELVSAYLQFLDSA